MMTIQYNGHSAQYRRYIIKGYSPHSDTILSPILRKHI
ncbi:hypothetical protein ECEC4196_2930, partial [Escherichia coli EC4196]